LWGTFSVIDHIDTQALVADVLLYDRLMIPCPPPEDKAYKAWIERGWKPKTQARVLRQIEGLYEPVFWDGERRKEFKDLWAAANAEIAAPPPATEVPTLDYLAERYRAALKGYEITQDMIRGRVETSLLERGKREGFGPDDIRVVNAYRSAEAFRRDFVITDPRPVPVLDHPRAADDESKEEPEGTKDRHMPDREAEMYRLVSRKIMLPADKDPDDALKRAVELAKSEDYQRHRRRFYGYIEERTSRKGSTMADRVALEDELAEMEKMEQRAFKSDRLEAMAVCVKTVIGMLPGDPLGIASSLMDLFGYFTKPAYVPTGPFAMFHDVKEMYRRTR
jgi:hypothetical protein